MGQLTLADFREDLQSALGDFNYSTGQLDRWINFGYLDLTGAVDFDILKNDESVNTVTDTVTITAPTNKLHIRLIHDTTSGNLLGWLPLEELMRRPQTTATGNVATHWTRHAGDIYLNPIPGTATKALWIVTTEPPAVLATSTAVTVLPDTWDPAVFQLAGHHAFMTLGQEQRSAAWLTRAVTYIQSRVTERAYQTDTQGMGADLPYGITALMNRIQGNE